MSAYPSRSLFQRPKRNVVLHASVALGVGLQVLTIVVPALRELLRLAPLDMRGFAVLVAAIAASWSVSEGASRALRPIVAAKAETETAVQGAA